MSDRPTWTADGRALIDGAARGLALVLDEPLSFWGGVDPLTGLIIDQRHPQRGEDVTGRVLVMPAGRGSSSSSTVLAEAARAGHGPAAILLREPDPIIVVGALVASLIDGIEIPVVVLSEPDYARIASGNWLTVSTGGQLLVGSGRGQ